MNYQILAQFLNENAMRKNNLDEKTGLKQIFTNPTLRGSEQA